MSKNDQIRRLIEAIVRKELQTIIPQVVPQVVKEVLSGMIMESSVSEEATEFSGNSNKRMRLTEQAPRRRRVIEDDVDDDMDEEPTPRQRRRPAVEWEDGEVPFSGGRSGLHEGLNVPTKAATESGNLVNINPAHVPDFVINAMNRDYSQFMKVVKTKSSHG